MSSFNYNHFIVFTFSAISHKKDAPLHSVIACLHTLARCSPCGCNSSLGFFPDQIGLALPITWAHGDLVDPPATMVNASTYIVSKYVDGKDWLQKKLSAKAE